jgi:hypothetical protein
VLTCAAVPTANDDGSTGSAPVSATRSSASAGSRQRARGEPAAAAARVRRHHAQCRRSALRAGRAPADCAQCEPPPGRRLHGRVVAQLLGRAVHRDAAVLEHVAVVGDAERGRGELLDQQHRHARAFSAR